MKVQSVLNSFIKILKNYFKNLSSFRHATAYNNFIIHREMYLASIFFSCSASLHE